MWLPYYQYDGKYYQYQNIYHLFTETEGNSVNILLSRGLSK
jgi:hypothetical protein